MVNSKSVKSLADCSEGQGAVSNCFGLV